MAGSIVSIESDVYIRSFRSGNKVKDCFRDENSKQFGLLGTRSPTEIWRRNEKNNCNCVYKFNAN